MRGGCIKRFLKSNMNVSTCPLLSQSLAQSFITVVNRVCNIGYLECILVFRSAMPRGVTCMHLCTNSTVTSPVNGRKFSVVNNSDLD